MKSRFAAALVVALGILAPVLSFAAEKGPYVSGALGFSQPGDTDIKGAGINTEGDSDLGYGLSAAVGNAFGNGWRAEGEINYRKTAVDSLGNASGAGDISGAGLMINGYYDFNRDSVWTPYVGAGIGRALISYNGVSPVGSSRIDDDDWVFAYQAIGGVSYKLQDQASIFSEYRYFGTADTSFRTDSGVNVDADYGEHRIMVGLRWSFNAPKSAPAPTPVAAPALVARPAPVRASPPPPAPAPVAEVIRSYLVFFDWDSSTITPGARAILVEVARNSRTANISRIEATGHADRSGTDRYNIGLSQRRAKSIAEELVRQGVPVGNIVIRWKGEREPLVATDDGIREPQNRRVEIVFN
ncbi:MAG: OmpA family protein [Rhodospirillales bacterium]|nr:OmpA family protein [Rhodospirillales bacterium]